MKHLFLKLKNKLKMKSLSQIVQSVMASNGIRYSSSDTNNAIQFGISAQNGNWQSYVHMQEETRKITFTSVCPIHTPDSRKTAICELLNRINETLFWGRFCMDVEDGEIRFQVSAAFPGSYVVDETINCMLQVNLQTFDTYMPALIAVIYGHNEPSLAFLEVQQAEA
jgi:hypothetical protein